MPKPKPIEDTYVAELLSVIKEIGSTIGFDAKFNMKSESGRTDVTLDYGGKTVAVIEVKKPEVALSDPSLNEQALRYADEYHRNLHVEYYATHNMRYLKLFKYVGGKMRQKTLAEFAGEKHADWATLSDIPFAIMPWAETIEDFKQISDPRSKRNLEGFLLTFRGILEGKTVDLSRDAIETIRKYIEEGASSGLDAFIQLYRSGEKDVVKLFENWRMERGIEKPKDDSALAEFLKLMLKEQLYTFSMKILFYLVLQVINSDMASRLRENLGSLKPNDVNYFKTVFDGLFRLAIEKTGDFEEVFSSNTVDRLPFVDQMLSSMTSLISYLNQIRWNEINVDIVGSIFQNLIYGERRHLLGQHFTDTILVDLIIAGTLREPGKLIDPACGSGSFLVRALNYWRTKRLGGAENKDLVEGVDIDKLASMLSKINLYIQSVEEFKAGARYFPRIRNNDFFQEPLANDYSYVIANPPYTRQEELRMAFMVKNYKELLARVVADIPDWSRKASIYAYFLAGGAKLLTEKGRLGFVVENSWNSSGYGVPLYKWFLDDFTVEYVIESIRERWFEDAAIITNIVIVERSRSDDDYAPRYIYLRKKLRELFGDPPSASDFVANENYYSKMSALLSSAPLAISEYVIEENENCRFVTLRRSLLKRILNKFGTCGILKGPRTYLEIVLKLLEGGESRLKMLGDVLELERGVTTNANDIFYLPSKYWGYSEETGSYLRLVGPSHQVVKISKRYLAPLIRLAHISDSSYCISKLSRERHEDYVLSVDDVSKVSDSGMMEYLQWAVKHIREENRTNPNNYPTIAKEIDSPDWPKLPVKTGAAFLMKNDMHKNFAIYLNRILNPQVDKRFYLGTPKTDSDDRVLFAVLNSVFTYLGMELIGRSNLGEGVLDIAVVDYEKIPVVDPLLVEKKLKEEGKLDDFLHVVDEMLKLKPVNVEYEARNDARLRMEEYILGSIGLGRADILDFYNELVSLVNMRVERAASVKEEARKARPKAIRRRRRVLKGKPGWTL